MNGTFRILKYFATEKEAEFAKALLQGHSIAARVGESSPLEQRIRRQRAEEPFRVLVAQEDYSRARRILLPPRSSLRSAGEIAAALLGFVAGFMVGGAGFFLCWSINNRQVPAPPLNVILILLWVMAPFLGLVLVGRAAGMQWAPQGIEGEMIIAGLVAVVINAGVIVLFLLLLPQEVRMNLMRNGNGLGYAAICLYPIIAGVVYRWIRKC